MKPDTLPSCLCACLLMALNAQALAQDASSLRQCRALADMAARLACYDAIPLPSVPAVSAVPATPAPAARPAMPLAVPVTPAAPAPAPETQFGLPAPADRVLELVTRYDGLFEGWRPDERIRLANGQVWRVVDGSSGVYNLNNPKVTIRRGALGRFVLDIEGANKTPTVRRVE